MRPKPYYSEAYGFTGAHEQVGLGGGVVLIEATGQNDSVNCRYLYSDINVLSAMRLNLIRRPKPQQSVLNRLRHELVAQSDGKIKLTKSAFVRACSAEHLLALAGLGSRFEGNWPGLLFRLLKHENLQEELPAPKHEIVAGLQAHLAELCGGRP
jgi:hypothetical protein